MTQTQNKARVRKHPIIALYFESENELKFYNLEAWCSLYFILKTNSILKTYAAKFHARQLRNHLFILHDDYCELRTTWPPGLVLNVSDYEIGGLV